MAGISKPNIENLGEEMTEYQILGSYSKNQSNGYGSAYSLFDGISNNSKSALFSLNFPTDYVKIKINKKCNLYRIGTPLAPTQMGELIITPTTYEKVNKITILGWELYIEGLEPGTYTFSHKQDYHSDTEWFFEEYKSPTDKLKNAIVQTIKDNELLNKTLPTLEIIK